MLRETTGLWNASNFLFSKQTVASVQTVNQRTECDLLAVEAHQLVGSLCAGMGPLECVLRSMHVNTAKSI